MWRTTCPPARDLEEESLAHGSAANKLVSKFMACCLPYTASNYNLLTGDTPRAHQRPNLQKGCEDGPYARDLWWAAFPPAISPTKFQRSNFKSLVHGLPARNLA
jgi:hypothetical protein